MMPPNFRQVTPKLYRSGAPRLQTQVDWLVNNYPQIRKIISLDQEAGMTLGRLLPNNVEHVMLPINPEDPSSIQVAGAKLKEMGGKIFESPNGSVLVHCRLGQDRTGFAIAIYDVIKRGMSPQVAIRNAESLGYGKGISAAAKKVMDKVIGAQEEEVAEADDIVSKVREEGHTQGPSTLVADTSNPVMDQTKVWYSALRAPEGDSYPPANIRSRINFLHKVIKQSNIHSRMQILKAIAKNDADKSAVIIRDVAQPGDDKFYAQFQKFLKSLGYSVDITGYGELPPVADLWIGYGKGSEALKAAPSTVKQLALKPTFVLTSDVVNVIKTLDRSDVNDAFLGGGPVGSPTAEDLGAGQGVPSAPHIPDSGMRSNYQGSIPGTNFGASGGTPGTGGPGGLVDIDPYGLVQL